VGRECGALTSALHWFETDLFILEENLVGLMAVNRDLVGQAERWDRSDRTVLDMDSSESPVHGQQEGSAYNGHFETVCYHPLFLFSDQRDCLAAKLRPGNVSSAGDWDELLAPEIERQQAQGKRVAFRADAAFARPAIYEALKARGVGHAILIPANKNLELAIEDLLLWSPGRPSRKPLIRYKSFHYQAGGWTTPRRVVAKVEHHVGELFPRVGFISRISRSPIGPSCGSTTSAARPSNGSRRGSKRRTGRDCPVIGSGRTRSGCS
jgi:Transposase DDE domain group 1